MRVPVIALDDERQAPAWGGTIASKASCRIACLVRYVLFLQINYSSVVPDFQFILYETTRLLALG